MTNIKTRGDYMLENMSWNFFENTGSIEAFLEYTKIRELNKNDERIFDDRDDN